MTAASAVTVTVTSAEPSARTASSVVSHERPKGTRDTAQPPTPPPAINAAQYGPYTTGAACIETSHNGPNSNKICAAVAATADNTTTRRIAPAPASARTVAAACDR